VHDSAKTHRNGFNTGSKSASSPDLVEKGISAFFTVPGLERHPVSFAFGQIQTALVGLGDYHPIVESFRAGEQESGQSAT
jgi:hypothetical protein